MPVGQTLEILDKSTYIPAEQQALAAVAAVCERGPVGEARQVVSWEDYQRVYGGFLAGRPDQHSIRRALDAGCWLLVSRVVHLTDPADLSSRTSAAASLTLQDRAALATAGQSTASGTFPARFSPGDTLVVTVDGGAPATATFNATRAFKTGAAATFAAVTPGHKLVLTLGGVRREVAFAGTENSQALYLDAINSQLVGGGAVDASGQLRLQSDHRGTGASLSVHADTDADVLASLGLTAGAGTAGTGNIADIEAVTPAEWTSVVQGAVSGCAAGVDSTSHPYVRSSTTGTGSSVLIGASSTLDTVLGFDNTSHAGLANARRDTLRLTASSDGTWAHALRVLVDDDPGDPTARFRLRVTDASGTVLEEHAQLSMTSTDTRYVVNVLRDESGRLTATDLASATVAPDNRPLAGSFTPSGGADGLSGLVQGDWIGDTAGRTGLHAFDTERGFRLVATPGLDDALRHDTQVAAVAWCAARKDCRYLGNVASTVTSSASAVAYRRRVAPFASGTAIDSAYGALYAAWHELADPVTRGTLWVPADGEVLAAHARSNAAGGVWFAPCGPNRGKLSSEVRRLRFNPTPAELTAQGAAGVNGAYVDPDFGMVLEGQKTLQKASSKLDRLSACLTVDFLGEKVLVATRPYRYEPNDGVLWRTLRNLAGDFLDRVGAKRGALDAWRVVCDESNNPSAERTAKRTHLDLYVIPTDTSEEQHIGIVVLPTGTVLE